MTSNGTYEYSSLKGIPSTTIYNEKYMQSNEFVPGPLQNKFYFSLKETSKSMCSCSDCTVYGCPKVNRASSSPQDVIKSYFKGPGCFLHIGSQPQSPPGWKGVVVESAKDIFERIPALPTVTAFNVSIDDIANIDKNIWTFNILVDKSPYKFFDYINIDNIGTSAKVLLQIPLAKTQVVCVNHGGNPSVYDDVKNYCTSAGLTKCLYHDDTKILWAR
jgi:hypothetical protein